MTTEQQVKHAITVILSDKARFSTSLNYAVDYCNAALKMTGHELGVQCIYILNNITHWRYPEAQNVRKTLKTYVKEN